MLGSRRCNASGTGPCLRRISTLLTVRFPTCFEDEKTEIYAILGLTGKKEGKTRLMNMVMQVHYKHHDIGSVLMFS